MPVSITATTAPCPRVMSQASGALMPPSRGPAGALRVHMRSTVFSTKKGSFGSNCGKRWSSISTDAIPDSLRNREARTSASACDKGARRLNTCASSAIGRRYNSCAPAAFESPSTRGTVIATRSPLTVSSRKRTINCVTGGAGRVASARPPTLGIAAGTAATDAPAAAKLPTTRTSAQQRANFLTRCGRRIARRWVMSTVPPMATVSAARTGRLAPADAGTLRASAVSTRASGRPWSQPPVRRIRAEGSPG